MDRTPGIAHINANKRHLGSFFQIDMNASLLHSSVHTQLQVKSYQVSSNGFYTPILEIRREDQWSSRNARSSDRHN